MGLRRVIALGEALIDFSALEDNVPLREVAGFARNPGGAPANVAVGVARMGVASQFVGCVGDDPFGHSLIEAMRVYGVDGTHTHTVAEQTSLAFVARNEGDPDFFFVRHPGADVMLRDEHVAELALDEEACLHFGTNSLAEDPIASTLRRLVTRAREAGALVSFDVNLRPVFWRDLRAALAAAREMMAQADLLKVNRAELLWLTGEQDVERALSALVAQVPGTVLCTLGEGGVWARRADGLDVRVTANRVACVDATGAGDSLIAAVLSVLARRGVGRTGLGELSRGEWEEVLRFASAAAAINIGRLGAMNAMATYAETEAFLQAAGKP
ncbi:hypothetical protein AYW79_10195 [Ferroacidibacillus organovorans]|uniref:Carbohydrate kinase PfkB domain-containing protein n=1 Tax=Ferroacidibacillus organovorans TaxID=1765683 RepID=A0A853K948_9BACL|nr:hypothetical protein AYJ22_11225 [Ferroacidibacillus organovorans]OAG93536.1 hypothetical protein AYW79_10195 [Ferroacidibacillus organovorans]